MKFFLCQHFISFLCFEILDILHFSVDNLPECRNEILAEARRVQCQNFISACFWNKMKDAAPGKCMSSKLILQPIIQWTQWRLFCDNKTTGKTDKLPLTFRSVLTLKVTNSKQFQEVKKCFLVEKEIPRRSAVLKIYAWVLILFLIATRAMIPAASIIIVEGSGTACPAV